MERELEDALCPDCSEPVGARASYCMHCGAEFDAPADGADRPGTRSRDDPADWGDAPAVRPSEESPTVGSGRGRGVTLPGVGRGPGAVSRVAALARRLLPWPAGRGRGPRLDLSQVATAGATASVAGLVLATVAVTSLPLLAASLAVLAGSVLALRRRETAQAALRRLVYATAGGAVLAGFGLLLLS